MIAALWSVSNRRPSPWQGLLIAPAVIYLLYIQKLEAGPFVTLLGGVVLLGSYATERGSEPYRPPPKYSGGGGGRSSPIRMPRIARRFGRPLWAVFGIWILLSIGLYVSPTQISWAWYLPDIFGATAGVWVGFRYYYWIAGISNRATLLLLTFASLILTVIIAGVFVSPYAQATSPVNQLFGIQYPASQVGLSSSMAAFGTPLVIFVGFSILFAGYRASRTVYVLRG